MAARVRDLGVGMVLGVLLTVLAYESWPDDDHEPGPTPVRAVRGSASAPEVAGAAGPAPVPAAPVDEVAQEIARLRVENQMLRGQLDMHGASEVPWPDDDLYRRAGLEGLVDEAMPGADVAYDCEEFPCIAVFSREGGTTREALDDLARETWMSLHDVLQPRLPEGVEPQWSVYHSLDGHDRPVVIVTWYPTDLAQVETRVEDRMERLRTEAEASGSP